jgi:hypothetical protein
MLSEPLPRKCKKPVKAPVLFYRKMDYCLLSPNINREVCFGNLSILAGETKKNHSGFKLINRTSVGSALRGPRINQSGCKLDPHIFYNR